MASDDREFQKRKAELEERMESLENERVSLMSEVEALRQKRTLLDLEKKGATLQATVDMLKMEKADLEGQIASIEGTQ
jgi:predicted  nucleic acid-binding Zn-ribbon protein